ncbi:MAG: alpha/beta hydrolase [Deltaproteobacteria bacterium]|nr:alpha/beta hydrolase [Deltaproteobacteria bacterium]
MLHVDERGSGEPVVLLHGAPMAPGHLLPLAEKLAKARRAIVVHLPGYGRSSPLEPYSMDASLAAIEDALLARKCDEAHLIGIGHGGYRAVAIAIRKVITARTLTVLAGGADLTAAEASQCMQVARMFRGGIEPASFLEEFALSPRGRERDEWVSEVRGWGHAVRTEDLARELESLASSADLRPELARLDIPLLARVGSIDAMCSPERTQRMLVAARRAVVEEVPGVGHALLCEDFVSTSASIKRHLTRAS